MKDDKKVENPVSREIVLGSGWNRFDWYLPRIIRVGGDPFRGYGVNAKLPKKAHEKWISYINGLERFRETIKREIKEVFSQYVFNGQSYLEIWWSPGGVTFNTDGNRCGIYISGSSSDYGYCPHNVDHYEQASVLFIALSIYLPRLYSAMEAFESGSIPIKKCTPLKEEIRERIKLNQQKGCDMESPDECIHWKTYICEHCSRNPEAFFLKTKDDLAILGDKWEPPGGIPGKNLCAVCGANISKPICPHCGHDNSDIFN